MIDSGKLEDEDKNSVLNALRQWVKDVIAGNILQQALCSWDYNSSACYSQLGSKERYCTTWNYVQVAHPRKKARGETSMRRCWLLISVACQLCYCGTSSDELDKRFVLHLESSRMERLGQTTSNIHLSFYAHTVLVNSQDNYRDICW